MGEQIQHKCGVVLGHTLHDVFSMLKSLQHRGRGTAGLLGIDSSGRLDVLTWLGSVTTFDLEDLHHLFPGTAYRMFAGHVRYPTKGAEHNTLDDAHPHVIGGSRSDHGSHRLFLDCDMAILHNGQVDPMAFKDVIDTSQLKTTCDSEVLLHAYREMGERSLMRNHLGFGTVVLADRLKREVIVMRDPTGIRPGLLARKGGLDYVVSEEVAARKNGAIAVTDLVPGNVYYFPPGEQSARFESIVKPQRSMCAFEFNYLGSPDSVMDGASIRRVRAELGKQLAQEHQLEGFDFVTYVPRSPAAAAESYSAKMGLPLEHLFYKLNDHRSFQEREQGDRDAAIESNLFLNPHAAHRLRGKRGLILEDSIVRGTVGRRLKQLVNEAGMAQAVLLSYTPPLGTVGDDSEQRGCFWGVDMPPGEDFVAVIGGDNLRNATPEEIDKRVGMEVRYLSREGMLKAFKRAGLRKSELCTYCMGGSRPF